MGCLCPEGKDCGIEQIDQFEQVSVTFKYFYANEERAEFNFAVFFLLLFQNLVFLLLYWAKLSVLNANVHCTANCRGFLGVGASLNLTYLAVISWQREN
jgi:hypothetical protein